MRISDLVRIEPAQPLGSHDGARSAEGAEVSQLWDLAAQLDDHQAGRPIVDVPAELSTDEEWSAQVGKAAGHLPQLKRYLMVRLILEVQKQSDHFRKSYVPTTQWRRSVRGRMVSSGLVYRAGRRMVDVECAFDEHTIDSPVHQLLKCALTTAAGLSGRYSHLAIGLVRSLLSGVSDISTRIAVGIAGRLRGSKSTRPLAAAVDLAKAVVCANYSTGADDAGQQREGVLAMVMLDMANFWEKAVVYALDAQAHPPPVVRTPYHALGSARAVDIGWPEAEPTHIFDCKYKELGTTPLVDDVNQMYVYTELYGGAKIQRSGLIYPVRQRSLKVWNKAGHHLGELRAGLEIFQIPFPKAAQTLIEWKSSVQDLTESMLELRPVQPTETLGSISI